MPAPVRPTTPRPAWAPVGAALAVHLLALLGWVTAQPQPSASPSTLPAHAGLPAMQTRAWTDLAASSLRPPVMAPADTARPSAAGVRAEDSAFEPAGAARADSLPLVTTPAPTPATTPSPSTSPTPQDADASALRPRSAPGPIDLREPSATHPNADLPPGSDDYLPRSQLTRAPVARRDIWLDYPDDAPNGRFEATLLLFIDEHGTVRHVRPQADAGMPERLLDQARQAFVNAAFEPGELRGQAVKSRIAIAVTFEASAAPRATGVR